MTQKQAKQSEEPRQALHAATVTATCHYINVIAVAVLTVLVVLMVFASCAHSEEKVDILIRHVPVQLEHASKSSIALTVEYGSTIVDTRNVKDCFGLATKTYQNPGSGEKYVWFKSAGGLLTWSGYMQRPDLDTGPKGACCHCGQKRKGKFSAGSGGNVPFAVTADNVKLRSSLLGST